MTEKKVREMEEVKTVEVVQDEQVYTLSRPITFEDKTYEKLNLDFESLNGIKLMSAEREMKRLDGNTFEVIPVLAIHMPYQAAVVAEAAGVFIGVIHSLSARDFNNVCRLAQSFLLSTD